MRALIAVVTLAALAWAGAWYLGASRTTTGLERWLEARSTEGWIAEGTVETRGFPNRFDSTITALELADPDTGLAWSAPFLQIFRLSYQRGHVILAFPPEQVLATPTQRITLTTGAARGSLVFEDQTDWTLDRSSFVVDALGIASTTGWTAALSSARLATRPSERVPGATDLGLELQELRPASPGLAALAEAGVLPGVIDRVSVDASVAFDAPWDHRAVEARRPAPTAIRLHRAELRWGPAELWLAGAVTVDAAGLMSGEVTVKAKNWRELLQAAKAAGWVPEALGGPLERGLELLSGLAGARDTLDVPLRLSAGQMSLGPIPLGAVPKLLLR